MPAFQSISVEKLFRLIGLPGGPSIIDIRTADQISERPGLIPGSVRQCTAGVDGLARHQHGRSIVIACADGHAASQGVAALLRTSGFDAEILEGGVTGWEDAGLPLIPESRLPPRDSEGRTRWVTRHRPKVDRIACPWLIRRFVDPSARFLFVAPADVIAVAGAFHAVPFDIDDDASYSHSGAECSFDSMLAGFGLAAFEGLRRLSLIVRGADTGRLEIAPEAAGLLAASLGLSRMYADDNAQLEAGMALYDAFYRWCRDATAETHGWESHRSPAKRLPGEGR